MIRADYFVITTKRNDRVDAHFPAIVGQYVSKPTNSRIMQYHGFRGSNGTFVGQSNDSMIIWSSGQEAHYVAKTLQTEIFESYSVARMDLQVTMVCLDADYWIEHMQPSKLYKATKVSNINERGTTMYVGSPASNLRLRVYNKTAQSGIAPDTGGDYIRFEIQCRNNYADKAFVALRNNMARSFYLMIIKRMVDTYTYNLVQGALQEADNELFVDTFPDKRDDPIERRKRWLEQTVLPSLRRMLLLDKDYIDNLIDRLYNGVGDDDDVNTY